MSDATRILSAIEAGDACAARELLPLVYDELRRLATYKLQHEQPGLTLQATALVHEAYLRLVGTDDQGWNSRGHFFAAAAEAMRRILVERARRKAAVKHGAQVARIDLDLDQLAFRMPEIDYLDLDAALDALGRADPEALKVVHLRFFAGLSIPRTAEILGCSPRKVDGLWAFARAWLLRELHVDLPADIQTESPTSPPR